MNKEKKNVFEKKHYVILFALLCTLLWGSAFPGVKISYQYFGITNDRIGQTMLLAGFRFTMAGIVTLVVYFIVSRRIFLPERQQIKGIIITGVVQTCLQYLFFYIGLSNITGAKGAILATTITFFSVFISHFMFHQEDQLNLRKVTGCIIGFIGILIINIKNGGNLGKFTLLGDGFMLLSTFSAALGAMISKVVAKKMNPVLLTGYQMTLGGTFLIIVGLLSGARLNSTSMKGYGLLVYLALVSAIAFSIWTTLLKYNQPSKIAIFNFAIPIFGAILSALFLGDDIVSIQNLLALLCVCMGIYVVNKV